MDGTSGTQTKLEHTSTENAFYHLQLWENFYVLKRIKAAQVEISHLFLLAVIIEWHSPGATEILK